MFIFLCLFLCVNALAQNVKDDTPIEVKVHNTSGSLLLGKIQVYYASQQGKNKPGDVYKTSGTGFISDGGSNYISLPNKNFQISVGYIANFLVWEWVECANFVPTDSKSVIVIGLGGEMIAKISAVSGVKRISSYSMPYAHQCKYQK